MRCARSAWLALGLLSLLRRRELISEAARGLDRDLGHAAVQQLLAQAAHVHVDEAGVAPGLVAPYAGQQVVAREHAARLGAERLQQLERGRSERERRVAMDR